MKTLITLSNDKASNIPKEFQDDDVRYPESLVKYFLKIFTKKGDKIFDPFSGFGTSLIVAEKMKRVPFGIEIDKKRYEFIKSKISYKNNIICGDSFKLNKNKFPKFDLSITSPPYIDFDEDNFLSGKGGYKEYIKDIGKIYSQIKQFMKKNSYIVIEVANLKGKKVTTLAWDIGKEVSKIFHFEGEVIINWKTKGNCKGDGNYGYGYDHSYCLIYKNKI